jgi:hypothetical protein
MPAADMLTGDLDSADSPQACASRPARVRSRGPVPQTSGSAEQEKWHDMTRHMLSDTQNITRRSPARRATALDIGLAAVAQRAIRASASVRAARRGNASPSPALPSRTAIPADSVALGRSHR